MLGSPAFGPRLQAPSANLRPARRHFLADAMLLPPCHALSLHSLPMQSLTSRSSRVSAAVATAAARLPIASRAPAATAAIAAAATMSATKRKATTIGTHSGTFHCDEAVACWMLKQTEQFAGGVVGAEAGLASNRAIAAPHLSECCCCICSRLPCAPRLARPTQHTHTLPAAQRCWGTRLAACVAHPADCSITRSRDPAVLADCDVVVDVGGTYEPASHRYDHHQRGFEEVFGHGFNTKLSSAGAGRLSVVSPAVKGHTERRHTRPLGWPALLARARCQMCDALRCSAACRIPPLPSTSLPPAPHLPQALSTSTLAARWCRA